MTSSPLTHRKNKIVILNVTAISGYFHVFMEWLFFITKPSALSVLPFIEKLNVFFVSGGVLVLLLLITSIILSIPSLLTQSQKWKIRLSALHLFPPAFMLSVTALILLDNFTYTLFKIGIITTLNAWRIIYTVIFILILRWMSRFVVRILPNLGKPASFLTLSLFALSTTGILATYFSNSIRPDKVKINVQTPTDQPNIIILGADGLSANYLSVYGYKTDTTPFLTQLARTSLIAENAFTNASSTTASTASVLTGREPAEVNVYRYPDILTDDDSFKHLPGILKSQGYQTIQIGTPSYVDAEKLNLLNGFDIVNNRSTEQPALDALRSFLGNSPSTQFIQTVSERATERLLHIFFLEQIQNPFALVSDPKVRMTDAERTDQIIHLLETSNHPLFIFSHFMNTHGPKFSSEHTSSSESSIENEAEWDVALYQEAIQGFDNHVREIYNYLAKSGKLDNTILVIYTDHGYRYAVNQRIPVIVHFPNNEHAGVRRNNVEVIDIPVTLLDYLDISSPEWMSGWSMLGDEPPAERVIVSIVAGSPRKIKPPFFQIKTVQMTVCQKWYALNVQENKWTSGRINGHTNPCPKEILPSDDKIRLEIWKYLEAHKYDVSSLQ